MLDWKAIYFLVYVEHISMEALACYESFVDEFGESTKITHSSSKKKLASSSRDKSLILYHTEESPITNDTTTACETPIHYVSKAPMLKKQKVAT